VRLLFWLLPAVSLLTTARDLLASASLLTIAFYCQSDKTITLLCDCFSTIYLLVARLSDVTKYHYLVTSYIRTVSRTSVYLSIDISAVWNYFFTELLIIISKPPKWLILNFCKYIISYISEKVNYFTLFALRKSFFTIAELSLPFAWSFFALWRYSSFVCFCAIIFSFILYIYYIKDLIKSQIVQSYQLSCCPHLRQ